MLKRIFRAFCAQIILASLFLACSSPAAAQPFQREGNTRAANFSADLSQWIINSSADSVTVSFTYSVPYSRIIFIKHAGLRVSNDDTFDAILTFSVDASDSVSGINYHGIQVKKIRTSDFDLTQNSKAAAEDLITMTLPKSIFKTSVELRDDSQQISYLSETKRLSIVSQARNHTAQSEGTSEILSTIFLDSLSKNYIWPNPRNGIAPFPHTIIAAILIEDTDALPLNFRLENRKGHTNCQVRFLTSSKGSTATHGTAGPNGICKRRKRWD